MRKIFIIISFALFPFSLVAQSKRDTASIVNVETYIHHISDINFRDQEYKIELWLYLRTKDSLWALDSLARQFAVVNAKNFTVTVIPQYQNLKALKDTVAKKRGYRRLVKISCTIIQNWHIDKYPFDKQMLDIEIYTLRPLRWLNLIPSDTAIRYAGDGTHLKDIEIENGWLFKGDSIKAIKDTCEDIFDRDTKYSAIHLSIPISRKHGLALFFKLFIGMYISFFVAFIAFFIQVKHFEPRFGLPVGGLFAAIGNKYIMESILPQSSEYTIVDTLHAVTIIAILLIILFSAISLKLSDSHSNSKTKTHLTRKLKLMKWIDRNELDLMKWIDRNGSDLILITYIILNVIFIALG